MTIDFTSIAVAFMSFISAIGVAFISAHQKREEKARKARQQIIENEEEERKNRDILQIELISTALDLSLISAKKLTDKHVNGDVEEAMEKAAQAKEDYKKFCERVIQQI